MDLRKILQMLKHNHDDFDPETWTQVATMDNADKMDIRVKAKEDHARKSQAVKLQFELKQIELDTMKSHNAYWEAIYEKYNIPREGSYHIAKDGKIYKAPKDAKHQVINLGSLFDDLKDSLGECDHGEE